MKSVEFEVETKFGVHRSRLEFDDSATQEEIDLAIKNHVDRWVKQIESATSAVIPPVDPTFDPFII